MEKPLVFWTTPPLNRSVEPCSTRHHLGTDGFQGEPFLVTGPAAEEAKELLEANILVESPTASMSNLVLLVTFPCLPYDLRN